MPIRIIDHQPGPFRYQKPGIYLVLDNWNDFAYYTLFWMLIIDEALNFYDIGSVKIGAFGQRANEILFSNGEEIPALSEKYFSLGQSDEYYVNLNELGSETRDEILTMMNDIVKNEELFEQALREPVTRTSLFRDIALSTATNQFRRIANGGARLTDYRFRFIAPRTYLDSSNFDLTFDVEPDSTPPTNIHVLIGRNGVGKTRLLNNMINSLLEKNTRKHGLFRFNDENEDEFANLISITFSAFDENIPKRERKDGTRGLQYSYIGLKQIQAEKSNVVTTKSTTNLKHEFCKSLDHCTSFNRKRWISGIEMLESDPNFKEENIKRLMGIRDNNVLKKTASDIFERLSSGHKIVLLTITRLIESLQEKSLVLIDEPEAHLHPPLLSAFIRALSELLITTNGVAIIATHSPVVLQEVPKSCVWKLRRTGCEAISERLRYETFGENVGVLTNEVFGLEVTHSGFYKLLKEVASKANSYEEAVNYFEGQLGMEARAILMTYYAKIE